MLRTSNLETIEPGIAVNARFRSRPVTGVERYAAEILARLPGDFIELCPDRRLGGPVGHAWEQAELPRRASGKVLWSPANTGPLAHAAHVVTIHDTGPLDHPEWYRPGFAAWYRFLWPRLAHRAVHLLTVSEFSKERMVQRFAVPPESVTVVPAGVDAGVFYPRSTEAIEEVRRKFSLPATYALFLGSIQPRKNLPGLLAAWEQVAAVQPGACLVVGGSSGPAFDAAGHSAGAGLSDGLAIRFLGRVPDEDLPALYSGAAVFIQPSFYEGAGLTLLEAMACGCPVTAGGNTALKEYAPEGAPLFDPHDVRAIRDAVLSLLEDDVRVRAVQSAGIERARAFTWARSATAVSRILSQISLPGSPRSGRRPPV